MINKIKTYKPKSFVTSMFFSLVVVTTLTTLANTFIGIVDGVCVQRYFGSVGTASISLANPVVQICYGIASLIGIGTQVVITKALASGKNDKAKAVFNFSLITSLVLGFALCIVGILSSRAIAIVLGARKANTEIFDACSDYLMGYSMGLPFLFLSEMLVPLVYLDNDKKNATLSIVATFIVNAGLDILLPRYLTSTSSIAIAQASGNLAATLILLIHFFRKNTIFKVSLKHLSFNYAKPVFISGAPTGIKNLVITTRVFVLNFLYIAIAGPNSSIVLAARGVQTTFSNLFSCGIAGLVSTVITLGAMFYNEEDESSLDELIKLIIKFSIIVGGVLTLTYFFSAEVLVRSYGVSEEPIINETVYAMRCSCLTIIFSAFNTAMLAFFQGTKRQLWAYFSTFMQSLVLQVVFVSILGFTFGTKGMWIGNALGYIVYTFIHIIIATIRSKKFPTTARDFFFLPKDFGYKKDKNIEFKITSIVDTFNIAEKVNNLAVNWNVSLKRRYCVASSAEELATYAVVSGFARSKGKHQINIRVMYKEKDDTILIRVRDDCPELDLKKLSEQYNSKDPAKNIALKLIVDFCKDINYNRVLKTNNLIIKF